MTKARPFRFGMVAESAPSREAWIELVRRAEDLGYATFLLADHYVNEFPPIAALMAAADAARTIRIHAWLQAAAWDHVGPVCLDGTPE